jgi:hypothetical protein
MQELALSTPKLNDIWNTLLHQYVTLGRTTPLPVEYSFTFIQECRALVSPPPHCPRLDTWLCLVALDVARVCWYFALLVANQWNQL